MNTKSIQNLELKPIPGERDWPEDYHDENGKYLNTCSTCRKTFVGYKRRVTCKVCAQVGEQSGKWRVLDGNMIYSGDTFVAITTAPRCAQTICDAHNATAAPEPRTEKAINHKLSPRHNEPNH